MKMTAIVLGTLVSVIGSVWALDSNESRIERALRNYKAKEVQGTQEYRAKCHEAAEAVIRAKVSGPRFSTLHAVDDRFTQCRNVGGKIWESRGVVEFTAITGKRVQQPWRLLFEPNLEGQITAIFGEVNGRRFGNEAAALSRAGLAY